jgi:spore germination protein KC
MMKANKVIRVMWINEVLDLMIRGHELRTDYYIAIAKGRNAEDMLKVMTPLENYPLSR